MRKRYSSSILLALVVSLMFVAGLSRVNTNSATAQLDVALGGGDVSPDFQPGDVNCPPGSLPGPPPLAGAEVLTGDYNPETCVSVVDRRGQFEPKIDAGDPHGHFLDAARLEDGGLQSSGEDPIPNPGTFVGGTYHLDDDLEVLSSSTYSAYMEVYPRYDPEEFEGYSDGVYITTMNRPERGIEFLTRYLVGEPWAL